ncbi:MAG: LysM peptidoglycan-binding domain-containing protein [Dehalococcoidia bacterium]|nr:LysM peptidoglycan-binding domain-containing protein [Dehalococcoidia bacterium]
MAPAGTFAYTVVADDTLFSIASRFGTTVAELQRLNDVPDPEELEVGAVLFIPEATPTPSPTATPQPTATPAPSGPSQRIDHGPRNSGKVALTFDMGGRVEPALDIMNWLITNDVRATIFITGAIVENADHDDGRQVLALIEAHPELFELRRTAAIRTPRFTELTAAQIADQLRRTEQAVASHSSLNMRPLFRPPEGAVDASVLDAVGAAGYAYTIMWDVDTIDWSPVSPKVAHGERHRGEGDG